MRTYIAKYYTTEFGVAWPIITKGGAPSAIAFQEAIIQAVESTGQIVIKFESVTEIL